MDAPTAERRLAATVDRLREQVARGEARAVVELAKGVLVARLGISPSQADDQLARLAAGIGVPTVELAADVVNNASPDAVTAAVEVDEGPSGPLAARLRAAESAALAAGDAQRATEGVLAHALAPLGAVAVAVWAAAADGTLRLAGSAGFTAEDARRWPHVPPDVRTAARRALAERGQVWFDPGSAPPTIGSHAWPHGARVVLPAAAGGHVLGVLEICWPGPAPRPTASVRRQLDALAVVCAHTLDLPAPAQPRTDLAGFADGLLDPTLVLTPHLDADGWLVDFRIAHANGRFRDPTGRPRERVVGSLLLEAYPMAGAETGVFERLERVHATGVPFHTDRTAFTGLVDRVPVTAAVSMGITRVSGCLLLSWRVLDDAGHSAALARHAQRLGRIGGFEEDLAGGGITWGDEVFELYGLSTTAAPIPLDGLAAHAHPDDAAAIGRFARTLLHHRRPASAVFRLHHPDGAARHCRVIAEPVLDREGALVAVRGAYQDVSAQHWTEAALQATRDRLAHTEQESAERNRLALHLQRAIMPSSQDPVDTPQLRVAARYRPAEKGHLVGGDWYDAVVLPGGRVLLSVGDIAGHGIEAATGMVLLRNALRGLAATGAEPDQLLAWLNVVAHNLNDRVLATALCGVYDPGTRTLTWARAGHLPPVLLRDGTATLLPFVDGLMLGARSEVAYQRGTLRLSEGDTLLMYTDGLIERRDCAVDESLGRLLRDAESAAGGLDAVLDTLLAHSDADTDDDTCLVGIHLRHPQD